jgi:hypothetical protein
MPPWAHILSRFAGVRAFEQERAAVPQRNLTRINKGTELGEGIHLITSMCWRYAFAILSVVWYHIDLEIVMFPVVEVTQSGMFKSEKGNHLLYGQSVLFIYNVVKPCQTHEACQLVTICLEAHKVKKWNCFFFGDLLRSENHCILWNPSSKMKISHFCSACFGSHFVSQRNCCETFRKTRCKTHGRILRSKVLDCIESLDYPLVT